MEVAPNRSVYKEGCQGLLKEWIRAGLQQAPVHRLNGNTETERKKGKLRLFTTEK